MLKPSVNLPPERFEGDFSSFWHLDTLPPLRRLSWWWWWWLVLIPDPERPGRSKQLMVLWSTRDCERIDVSGHDWWGGGRTHTDEDGGIVFPGMIASWWFDGNQVFEPLVLREARMASLPASHSLWGDKDGEGGGAVIPLLKDDLSMGLAADRSHFWLKLTSDDTAIEEGAPSSFSLKMRPWNNEISALEYKHNVYVANMGYDILRIHGTKCSGVIDGEEVEGTAYFQKVTVQAPSIPWFWGMLHFDDGSYLDWWLPHLSLSATAKNSDPWKLRDFSRLPLTGAGMFKDSSRQRTEKFERCEVKLIQPKGKDAEFDSDGNPLPQFHIRIWNGRTQIGLLVKAVGRAHWSFNQPTRAHMTSHFTYNEYPLMVEKISILDEKGVRTLDDWKWIHGNAEHSWGILH
ncbi:MAG: hypothetical protein QF831_00700 [Candidatus Thalassarchaeaceae archaeon]|nr:hypothetical protein [Candidatus Thalassarchaeaceae archaeon]